MDYGPDPNPGASPTVFRMELDYLAGAYQLRIQLYDEGGSDYLLETIAVI